MSVRDAAAGRTSASRARTMPAIVGVSAAVLVAGFVLTSGLISTMPEFRFESQFPALLPFFAWAAATGVAHLANLGRALVMPWRRAYGFASLVPYVALLAFTAALPGVAVPWWLSAVAAIAAALPFLLLAAQAGAPLHIDPIKDADDASLRGTFLVGVGLMLMAYAVSGPVVAGAVVAVLLAVALSVAGLMPHGLARASRTWRLRHWAALTWGSLVVWASVLLHGMTSFFGDTWFVFTVVVLAGAPMIAVNSAEARRGRVRA